jgi:hypothetical protein
MSYVTSVPRLIKKYLRLKNILRSDVVAAESLHGGVLSGSFSLRSMQVRLARPLLGSDARGQSVLAHELYHVVQICQFPAVRSMVRALHEVDRWVMLVFLEGAKHGICWPPGMPLLEALRHPDLVAPTMRVAEFAESSLDILLESLEPRASGLSLLDLIEGAAYTVETITAASLGVAPVDRPPLYTNAWKHYQAAGGKDLRTFAMLVHACMREGAVAGPNDDHFAHPVDMFEHLVAFALYFETGDLDLIDTGQVHTPTPPANAEDSYRVVDHDPVSLAGRSRQRFSTHIDLWDPQRCARDVDQVLDDISVPSGASTWGGENEERARRIVKRLFMAYVRGANAMPNEPVVNERFIVDQFTAFLGERFSQLRTEAFIWTLVDSGATRRALTRVIMELAQQSVRVRLMDAQPALPLQDFFRLGNRIRDLESVLMLHHIDAHRIELDEDPTPWVVSCCPDCRNPPCPHGQWSETLVDSPSPLQYYAACSCPSGLPATVERATGVPFRQLISKEAEVAI